MPTSDVGRIMLLITKDIRQGAGFTYVAITTEPLGTGMAMERGSGYPFHQKQITTGLLRHLTAQPSKAEIAPRGKTHFASDSNAERQASSRR